ncbi:MAG TPA: MarC family protein [Planctomycetota bacterium]|jgi:multiple antibiotic resistance protein|nr:MarC family protein [Planctomycetota bacterium]
MFDTWIVPMISILFIVDPLAVIPTFLTMTQNDTPEKRRQTALKAAVACTLILALFASAGGLIFKIFGITLPAFRIAGGIILGLSALEMVRAERRTRENRDEVAEGSEKEEAAITPLAIPMLAGPGAISTVLVLMNRASGWSRTVPVYTAIAAAGMSTFLILRASEPFHRMLGKTGINVLSRLMGLVLATVAVQFILDGLHEAGVVRP